MRTIFQKRKEKKELLTKEEKTRERNKTGYRLVVPVPPWIPKARWAPPVRVTDSTRSVDIISRPGGGVGGCAHQLRLQNLLFFLVRSSPNPFFVHLVLPLVVSSRWPGLVRSGRTGSRWWCGRRRPPPPPRRMRRPSTPPAAPAPRSRPWRSVRTTASPTSSYPFLLIWFDSLFPLLFFESKGFFFFWVRFFFWIWSIPAAPVQRESIDSVWGVRFCFLLISF